MIIPPGASVEAVRGLRDDVFVREQGISAEAVHDDAVAWTAVSDDGLATGRLIDPGGDVALGRIGRMAVAASARRQGRGLAIIRELEAQARRLGLVGVDLHAQLTAYDFYVAAGYEPVGDPYEEQGLPHHSMQRVWAPVRPVRDDDALAVQALVRGCWDAYPGVVLDVDAEEPWMRAPASARPCTRMWVLDDVSASVAVSDAGELKTLYVSAASRRRGLGESLARLAERCGARVLWSDTRFLDAHRLYERLGWVRTGASRELHDLSATVEWEFVLP